MRSSKQGRSRGALAAAGRKAADLQCVHGDMRQKGFCSGRAVGALLASLGMSLTACSATPFTGGRAFVTTTNRPVATITRRPSIVTKQAEPDRTLLQRALSTEYVAVYQIVSTSSGGKRLRFTEVSVNTKQVTAYWTISLSSPVTSFGVWLWHDSHRHPVQCQGSVKVWDCSKPVETNGFSIALSHNPPAELAEGVETMQELAKSIQVGGPGGRCVRFSGLGVPDPQACIDGSGFVVSYKTTSKNQGFMGITNARLVFIEGTVPARDRYPSSSPPQTPS